MSQRALPVPDWFRKSAVYQINPRTFSPQGTLGEVGRELGFLRELGFRVLYLCPVFRADASQDRSSWSKRQLASATDNPKNPYRIEDYFQIDQEYGSMEDLAELIRQAHSLDMKVLLDLVYLHIGPNAPVLKSHPEFVQHNADGTLRCTEWNFPILDFASPGLREYLYCNMAYYIGALDADGFRCDTGDEVPNDFWIEGLRRIQAIKADAVLINEGRKVHRLATSFHSCYSFGWHEDVYWMLRGEIPFAKLLEQEKARLAQLPEGGLWLRDMDNHDTVTDWPERMEKYLGHAGMDCIQALNYALPGIPMVYCGNELADTARHSMFANRFHRGAFEVADRDAQRKTAPAQSRMALMKLLNRLLREHPAMHSGEITWIDGLPEGILSFYRQGGEKKLLFACNLSRAANQVSGALAVDKALLRSGVYREKNNTVFEPFGYVLLEK